MIRMTTMWHPAGFCCCPLSQAHIRTNWWQGTKSGAIYLIDRDQMTNNNKHYCSGCTSDPEIVREILNAGTLPWLWAAPAYWNNTVYFWGSNDVLKAYTLTNGRLGAGPSSISTYLTGVPRRDSLNFSQWNHERHRVGD